MVENSSGLALNFDVVADVFPLEYSRLTLDDRTMVDFSRSSNSLMARSGFDIIRMFGLEQHVATPENQNLTLGLLGCDEFCGQQVRGH